MGGGIVRGHDRAVQLGPASGDARGAQHHQCAETAGNFPRDRAERRGNEARAEDEQREQEE